MSGLSERFDWVEYAEEDLIMAKSALRRSKPLPTSSCFHSQQCAEKYLKAILLSQDIEFPKTHDLLILNMLCAEGLTFGKGAIRYSRPGRIDFDVVESMLRATVASIGPAC